MDDKNLYLKNLISKDEDSAIKAAEYLINNSDTELFSMLVNKTDYLFDFVKNNVIKRIEKVVNKNNFINIINFFDIYSSYYDDLFASILAKHANEDLTDKIFELLENGNTAQKTYAAKYFVYIPDTVALETLNKYAFSDDENLSSNSAEALGQMQDDVSFDTALSLLNSNDDFERLKAVRFFTAFGRDFPLDDIFQALKTSKIPENIAGQIPYMVSLLNLIKSEQNKENALITLDYILSGLGEILPLSDIFQFELYEIFEYLLSTNSNTNNYEGKIASILLKAFLKFSLFTENPEYIFDEDKDTKYEISAIFKLLKSKNDEFWKIQKKYLLVEFKNNTDERILSILQIISDINFTEAAPLIKELLNSSNEIIICEALSTLKNINALNDIDIDLIVNKITNPNIKAFIMNLKNN